MAAIALGVTGCGSADAGSTVSVATTTADLHVSLDVDGPGGKAVDKERQLCGPNIDNSTNVCEEIDKLPADFAAPTPPGTACTEIFGGPEVVKVTGTLHGEEINTKLTRANGCEIDRFDSFTPILEDLFPDYESGGAIAG